MSRARCRLKVGDRVRFLGRYGKPIPADYYGDRRPDTAIPLGAFGTVSTVMHGADAYRITFDNGAIHVFDRKWLEFDLIGSMGKLA